MMLEPDPWQEVIEITSDSGHVTELDWHPKIMQAIKEVMREKEVIDCSIHRVDIFKRKVL